MTWISMVPAMKLKKMRWYGWGGRTGQHTTSTYTDVRGDHPYTPPTQKDKVTPFEQASSFMTCPHILTWHGVTPWYDVSFLGGNTIQKKKKTRKNKNHNRTKQKHNKKGMPHHPKQWHLRVNACVVQLKTKKARQETKIKKWGHQQNNKKTNAIPQQSVYINERINKHIYICIQYMLTPTRPTFYLFCGERHVPKKKVIPDSPHPLICASSGQPPDEPKWQFVTSPGYLRDLLLVCKHVQPSPPWSWDLRRPRM